MTGSELRAIRIRLGLTQAELARILRLANDGKRSVRSWEAGHHPISGPVSVVMEALADGKIQQAPR